MSEVTIFDDLIGDTIIKINRTHAERGSYGSHEEGSETDTIVELEFLMQSGKRYRMWHEQDCCEWVYLDDIDGELSDLIGAPLEMAEEVTDTGGEEKDDGDGSHTWTFYKFATINGYVTLKWYGESNGYYSESVQLGQIKEKS